MDKYMREDVVLASFMGFLVAVILFLSVYAPEPIRPPRLGIVDAVVNASQPALEGWSALFSDISSLKNVTG